MFGHFNAAWAYREFVVSSIVNEYRTRYARSRFGTLWIILQPLVQVVLYAAVLSNILGARLGGVENQYAYAVYLLAGILCWSLFSEIVQRSLTVFIDNASILRKVRFPRIALPLIVVGSSAVANAALFLMMMVILPFLGFRPNVFYVWLPALALLTIALSGGLGLLLGTLNVFMRDVGQIVGVLLQIMFWMTPIIYPPSVLDGNWFNVVLDANPLVPLVTGYHDVIVYARPPQVSMWLPTVTAIVALMLAMFVFRRASADMVDSL